MALILKGGAIFLHIPKTGGSWITKVLHESGLIAGKIGHKHADIDHLFSPNSNNRSRMIQYNVKRLLGIYPKNPFLFCFVRHPLSWYESWFKYMSQPDQQWRHWGNEHDLRQWHPNAILNGLGDPDFNQFVRNVIHKRAGYVTEMYSRYTAPHINFIGKLENLHHDLIQVLNQLQLNFDENLIRNHSPVNKSNSSQSVIKWDPNLKKEVLKLEQIAITRYGYDSYLNLESDK